MTAKDLPTFSFLDPMIVTRQYIKNQAKYVYVRDISDTAESVGFSPDSSLRFWYNDTDIVYDSHWHSAFEMIVPIEGVYLATVGQQTYELVPGDIFLIPGGELHTLRPSGPGGRFIFLFDLAPLLAQIKGTSYISSCLTQPVLINRTTCPSIYETEALLVAQISQDYLNEGSLRDVTVYAKLLTFIANYGKFRLTQEVGYSADQPGQKSYTKKFHTVLDYMDKHFDEDLTLEHVADVAGFSKFHFSRIFKQLSGYNFYDYLLHLRIKSSEALLMKPGLSISQIALQSGFSSVSTFNRTFKKIKSCTPTQYRGMFREQSENYQPGGKRHE